MNESLIWRIRKAAGLRANIRVYDEHFKKTPSGDAVRAEWAAALDREVNAILDDAACA